MNERFRSLRWTCCIVLLLALAASCGKTGTGGASAATGGKRSHAGGATSLAGAAGDTSNLAGSANIAGSTSAAGGTSVVGTPDPPAAPPTSDVPQPSGAVTSANLRVLPWAGFTAAITYTLDDTQPSQTEHWPELQAAGVPMTFFANPSANWQSGYDAAWTAVAAAGSEIGNHTWSHCHPNLTGCTNPLATAEDEIDKTTTYITTHFGVPAVYSFASPFGDSGWNTYAAPRLLAGRGVSGGLVPASGQSDWYNLPVIAVSAGQTAKDFDASIDSAHSQGRWGIFLIHSLLPTSNNWYAGVEISDITASIGYAQSLGDVWIDSFVEVSAYARAQQMFEKLTPAENTWTWTLPEHFPPGKVLRVTVDGGTLSQSGAPLTWDAHGYYEVALDVGTLRWDP
jgi:peptidoglycan/xylan/chitin deacetylase (PgdA/CDA1 family)